MEKVKKVLVPLLAAALVVAAVGVWFFLQPGNVYKAIPKSAVAVVDARDWAALRDAFNTTYTGMEFFKTDFAKRMLAEKELAEKILAADRETQQQMSVGGTAVSVHLTSAGSYGLLWLVPISGLSEEQITQKAEKAKGVKRVSKRVFKGKTLIEVELSDGTVAVMAYLKNILVFSTTSFLTEASVSAVTLAEGLSQDKAFCRAEENTPHTEQARFFFNLPKLTIILPVFARPNTVPLLSGIQNAGSWAGLAVAFSNNTLTLNGYLINEDRKEAHYRGEQLKQDMQALVPANAAVAQLAVNDTATFTYSEPLAAYFKNWIGPGRAFVTLEPLSGSFKEQNILVLQVRSKQLALTDLMKLLRAESSATTAVDTFMNEPVYRSSSGPALNRLFNNSFSLLGDVYFTVGSQVAVFGNNSDVVKLALENMAQRNTLQQTEQGVTIDGASNMLLLTPPRSTAMLPYLLNDSSSAIAFYTSFSQVAIKTVSEKGKIKLECVLQAGGNKGSSTGLLWKLQLKTAMLGAPSIVIKPDGAKEIFTQDTAGNMYLVNTGGEIIFTRHIGNAVLSGLTCVDYYGNGGLQYLFNTATHIYLIDATGKDVASYPLRLSTQALYGMAVYQAGNQVNCYVPCANNSIYGYQLSGRPLPGWSPKGTGPIKGTPYILNTNNRTTICCRVNDGFRMFDKSGNLLWKNEALADTLPADMIAGKDGVNFLWVSNSTVTISNEGKTENIFDILDNVVALAALPVNDTAWAYVYSNGNALRAYRSDGTFMGAAGFEGAYVAHLQKVSTNNATWLLAHDTVGNTLHLLNTQMQKLRKFAVPAGAGYCVTPLFSAHEPVLLTATARGNLSCIR